MSQEIEAITHEAIDCPYCHECSRGQPIVRKVGWPGSDKYFESNHALYKCEGCGLYYAAPRSQKLIAGLKQYYAEYYNSSDRGADPGERVAAIWNDDPIRRLLRPIMNRWRNLRWRKHLISRSHDFGKGRTAEAISLLYHRGASTVLDVGCAHGGFVRSATSMGLIAYGIEPDEKVVASIRSRGIDTVTAGFFPEKTGPLRQYDAITMFCVVCYMPDVSPELFRASKTLLSPGGTLLIFDHDVSQFSNPELDSTLRSPLVFNFKSPDFMQRVAHDAGFVSYEMMPCRGEPNFCFHLMTAPN